MRKILNLRMLKNFRLNRQIGNSQSPHIAQPLLSLVTFKSVMTAVRVALNLDVLEKFHQCHTQITDRYYNTY